MKISKILIIEDDEDMCEEIKNILEEEHYVADVAHNGLEGKVLFEKNIYDLILLDLKMPGMSGGELLKYIKGKTSSAVIFVITGSPIGDEFPVGMEKTAGEGIPLLRLPNDKDLKQADVVIHKPFDIEKLLSKIKEMLNQPRT